MDLRTEFLFTYKKTLKCFGNFYYRSNINSILKANKNAVILYG